MLSQVMDSRWTLQKLNKFSIGLSPRPSKPFNHLLAFLISIFLTLKFTDLTSLLKKDSPFIFNEEALSQFQLQKEAFTTSPIVSHFNPALPAIVETDASDYTLGSGLSQVNDSGKHPSSFDSRKLLPAELNYEIYDKELLA
ncbi:hypothetical protein O181_049051 [Austropuccinia psidii MF-1]|uniref:Reverse transcriptase/retrotransposon-derived protein RNase H-like domain-containing protein n=1 Tax=Austropuccinia psidii MF-1 TaxID=1389203 RepID=A0A9Q3HKZ9_9BASI|nr:hypothetical protein [Austropuccinia psidii MF-1]